MGRSVRFDIDAVDSVGAEYDIEIQQASADADPRRARYHSSVIDSDFLRKRQDFTDLRETYVIFITKYDVLKGGAPIYFIERMVTNLGTPFGDGEHIVYVNGADKDVATELGKLVHGLNCRNPDEMFFKPLADVVRYFKETEEGREKMCQIMEELINEAVAENTENNRTEIALKLLEDGTYSLERVAYLTSLPVDKVRELASQLVG